MLNINKKIVLSGVGLCAFVIIGVANIVETTLARHLNSNPHLGLGLAAFVAYFYGVTKLSKSKHNAAVVATLGFAAIGYAALAAFLVSALPSFR